ncbi:MAG: flagellin [Vampirovibrionales bacterium]|jgi:flagellin|nr:flagellin [Vampirovibrionales bacterium]
MPLQFINTNLNAIRSLQTLRLNTARTDRAAQDIASGKKINTSSDDAGGYAISQRFTADILTGQRADQNIQDGLSMLQVTEGSISVMSDNLQRIRELAVQMANDVNGADQRNSLAKEMRALLDDMNRLSTASQFNGMNVLDGSLTDAKVQIAGGSNLATNTIDILGAFAQLDTTTLGLEAIVAPTRWTPATLNDIFDGTTTQLNSSERVLSYLGDIDNALTLINGQRSTIGALSNQLERAGSFLGLSNLNIEASRSRIVDTDIAKASAEYTQAQVLQNAAVSILQQANVSNQAALQLLKA